VGTELSSQVQQGYSSRPTGKINIWSYFMCTYTSK